MRAVPCLVETSQAQADFFPAMALPGGAKRFRDLIEIIMVKNREFINSWKADISLPIDKKF